MKPRFTISRKIGFGFAVVLFTTLLLFFLTYDTLKTGRETNDRINEVYNPSIGVLEQLNSTVLRSRTSITAWAFVQSREDTKEKMALVRTINEEIPALKNAIDSLSVQWNDVQRRKKDVVYKELDGLLSMYATVQNSLSDMRSYDDPFTRFTIGEYAEEDGQIYHKSRELISELNELINDHQSRSMDDSITMIRAFDRLDVYLRVISIVLFLVGVIIAYFTIRSIVKPVSSLKSILEDLGKGIFPEKAVVNTGDEIGEMSVALDQLVTGLKRTTEFSRSVGQGNFDVAYEPLSKDDVLGTALLSMRDDLREYERRKQETERELEDKVQERTKEVVKQKNKIEKQNQQRKELLDNITASIRYAKRLQESFLPSESLIKQLLPDNFIFFKPKDIVSGDFYFVEKRLNKIIFAVVDCTGHGVPGAFMSLVGYHALTKAVDENPDLNPAAILGDLSRFAAKALHRISEGAASRDGMDLCLCVYDPERSRVSYAGAFNPMYIVRNSELVQYKPDKIVIGDPDSSSRSYTTHDVALQANDMIYLSTDGYVDQFGGSKGRKFMYAPFRKMLCEMAPLPLDDQQKRLSDTLNTWRRSGGSVMEQVDDILVMGVRHK